MNNQASRELPQQPVCKTCNGTKTIHTGEEHPEQCPNCADQGQADAYTDWYCDYVFHIGNDDTRGKYDIKDVEAAHAAGFKSGQVQGFDDFVTISYPSAEAKDLAVHPELRDCILQLAKQYKIPTHVCRKLSGLVLKALDARVTVKPLEFCHGEAGLYVIESAISAKGGLWWAWAYAPDRSDPFFVYQYGTHETSEAACEAAANTHHEAAILSELGDG